jgi:hypothetical protein
MFRQNEIDKCFTQKPINGFNNSKMFKQNIVPDCFTELKDAIISLFFFWKNEPQNEDDSKMNTHSGKMFTSNQ